MSVYHNIYNDSKNYNEKIEELKRNAQDHTFIVWSQMYNTALSTFKWKNLPKDILPFMPEEQLIYFGQMAYFLDDDGKPQMYPAYMAGKLLPNGLYSHYYMVAKNGKVWNRELKDIELCFGNSSRLPAILWINEFADRTAKCLTAIDACIERITLPVVFGGGDTDIDIKKIESLYSDVKNHLPVRIANTEYIKSLKDNKLSLYDAREIPLMDIWGSYVRYRNMFYTMYGIDNVEQEKGERLTLKESASNDQITRHMMAIDMDNCRKDFCKRVKEHFGHDLQVILDRNFVREDGSIIANEQLELMEIMTQNNEISKGVEENGTSYDR